MALEGTQTLGLGESASFQRVCLVGLRYLVHFSHFTRCFLNIFQMLQAFVFSPVSMIICSSLSSCPPFFSLFFPHFLLISFLFSPSSIPLQYSKALLFSKSQKSRYFDRKYLLEFFLDAYKYRYSLRRGLLSRGTNRQFRLCQTTIVYLLQAVCQGMEMSKSQSLLRYIEVQWDRDYVRFIYRNIVCIADRCKRRNPRIPSQK